jgi:3-phenylpropionate/trans-cinnamate dioxygenase ferredoxin subunit
VSFELVGPAADIAKGTAISVEISDVGIAVVHADDGNYYAVRDECSHAAVALSEGEIDGCTLECWLHGSRFDLRTGEPSGPPASRPVPVYLATVEGEGDDAVVLVDVTVNASAR